jgi:exopolyphosphatase/guanosine-5'-triphosphate,3'-diphosphate pyrophosphatase
VRITAIDVGTNTILMLIADLRDDGAIRTLRDEIAFPRLGKGVDESGLISPESTNRALNVLSQYQSISVGLGSEKIVACGTSALRDSRNRDEIISRIRCETSIDVEVLSGEDEARLTFLGALTQQDAPSLKLASDDKRFAVIDIGGGSTEVTLGTSQRLEKNLCFDLGCVRLTERFLRSTPPTSEELERASDCTRSALTGLHDIDASSSKLVGVAGTVTTLAALDRNLSEFEANRVDGYVLPLTRIMAIFEQMRPQALDQIRSSPVISSGRADVLLAGILILIEFMAICRFDRITTSSRGLRYGLVLREFERMRTGGNKG